jgi:pimeloyl-ACP methyl ester carboxylesterase
VGALARKGAAASMAGAAGIGHDAVEVAGGCLHLAVAGRPDAPGVPLILLHGWTLDWRMWLPQALALGERHLLVMPDRRGFGSSDAPPDLSQEAEDVAAIADHLGLDRFALIGLSQGAAIALDFAHRFPTRLAALVASGAPLPQLVERDETIPLDHYEAWARDGDLAALRRDWSTHELMRRDNAETAPLIEAMLADYAARDLLAPSVLAPVPRAALARIEVPLLATTGTHDSAWRRDCAAALGELAPQGRFAPITGAGHLANLDRPQEFNRVVGHFLADCAQPIPRFKDRSKDRS